MLNMDAFRRDPKKLPRYLYRVQYSRSQTVYEEEEEREPLEAQDPETFLPNTELDREEFKIYVEKHFDWSNRDPSPFISLFSDGKHAMNWGNKQPWSRAKNEEWSLVTIDTSILVKNNECYIFRLADLVHELGVEIPKGAQKHIPGAYIVLHRIPKSGVC